MLILATVVLFIGSMAAFAFIPFEFAPAMDSGSVAVEVELPEDASLDQTAEVLNIIEDRIAGFSEVNQIVTNLGSLSSMDSGTNMARLNLQLINKDLRQNNVVIAGRISAALSDLPGVVIRTSGSSGMGGGGAPVAFYLQGNDLDELKEYTTLLKEKMILIPGVTGINSSFKDWKA